MDTTKLIDKLRPVFKEMWRKKSDFDILKFTLDKEWPFIAHQYHFVMCQYKYSLSELKRFYLEKERLERLIKIYKTKEWTFIDNEWKEQFYDLQVEELIRQLDDTEYEIVDKKARCERYEYIRLEMEKLNWWPITDEQYQQEEPEYWKWNLTNQARQELIQKNTWISKWVVNALDMSSIENKLLPDYRINDVLNNEWQLNIEKIINWYTPKIKYNKIKDKSFYNLIDKQWKK